MKIDFVIAKLREWFGRLSWKSKGIYTKAVICVLVCVLDRFMQTAIGPVSDGVIDLFGQVIGLVLFVVLFLPIALFIKIRKSFVLSILNVLLSVLVLLLICRSFVAMGMIPVDSILFGIKSDVDQYQSILIATFILTSVFTAGTIVGLAAKKAMALSHSWWSRPRTQENITRTAYHEAGHVLVFACWKKLPPELTVEVLYRLRPSNEFRGRVKTENYNIDTKNEISLRIELIKYVSGLVAERVFLNYASPGAAHDYVKWMELAHTYLIEGYGGPYHIYPHTPEQETVNSLTLAALKKEIEAESAGFLRANSSIVVEIVDLLKNKRIIGVKDLGPLLSRVTLTKGLRKKP